MYSLSTCVQHFSSSHFSEKIKVESENINGIYQKVEQQLWRTIWKFLKKLKIELPYAPEIPVLGKHPEKATNQKDKCTPLFISALFTIARTWKQPKYPSAEE